MNPQWFLYVKELPPANPRRYVVVWGPWPKKRRVKEIHIAAYFTYPPAAKLVEILTMLTEYDATLLMAERLGKAEQ